ncbi:cadmium-translocating P-type ATPase [Aquabacter sp. L1I39]|uniref:heavy metal translocating P-type ATPase n=1 Tax=Aquabacter sp. L1I39 TaxID=2820278 RepID=UPI001ADB608B|nr:heavy metal translocating P-type ATPase [Aquabacter sp. L1I39]QTL03388.1 cadmium-translocating P-type ATPase [Aquabacter sp. L1I39]
MSQASSATTRFRVEGMDCASCALKIETAVRRLPGVAAASVSVQAGTLIVEHGQGFEADRVTRQVAGLGYGVRPANAASPTTQAAPCCAHAHADHAPAPPHDHSHAPAAVAPAAAPWWRSRKARQAVICGLAIVLAWMSGRIWPASDLWVFLAALLVGLLPIARRALAAARAGAPFTIETLMTIAAVGAVAIGAAEEAAAVVFLFLIGEILEGVAASRARASIAGLTALLPKTALLQEDGSAREVPAETLIPGAVILVRPGDRIAADGLVLEGESAVDEAPVTGESMPKLKAPGDTVFAGTINGEAGLKVEVTAAAADNTIARIVKLVEEAQESKAPTERFIDKFSRYYTPLVLVAGALVALVPPLVYGQAWGDWTYRGLAVLLIGCPCALVISTPAAIAAGLAAGARRGLLMKGGAVLERLRQATLVAFDKTGTLTEGRPVVTDIVGLGRTDDDVLALAAAVETGSSHPLATAILSAAGERGLAVPPVFSVKAIPGQGVAGVVDGVGIALVSPRAATERSILLPEQVARIAAFSDDGKTVAVLLINGAPAGILALRDGLRSDAEQGIRALRDMGISAAMLTGDNPRAAAAIAAPLGIEAHAGLLPQDKQRQVLAWQSEGQVVLKVGDGINDAPALAAADIGIAMGGGTDVALETADAAILHGRVADVARMVRLSRQVMQNIAQNIAIALGLKAIFLVTTIASITGLWPAILADTGATVLVTLNALRLLSPRLD